MKFQLTHKMDSNMLSWGESSEVSIETKDELKLRMSKGTDLDILVNIIENDILI